jgi:putrescine:ornithine antiporter
MKMTAATVLLAFGTLAHAQIVEPGGRLTIGYYTDAKPFSYENESGRPAGYAVELCRKVVDLAKAEVNLSAERIAWVPMTAENRLAMLREKKIRVLCGEPVTLAAQKEFAFSIPIFQGGVGALVRSDAPAELVKALSARAGAPDRPALQNVALAVVAGTPTEQVVAEQVRQLQISATVARVKSYGEGLKAVLQSNASVFFADRSVLLDAVRRDPSFSQLKVIDRRFTVAPVAIALARGNDDARLAVDRALSRIYASDGFRSAYVKWFGRPDADTLAFFRLSALPD